MEFKRRESRVRSSQYSAKNQALRDTINASHYQLQKCREELDDTKNKLKCLIGLVRRAWSGDVDAAFHVANIIGIAPPDLHLQGDTNRVIAVPKPAAINNWACLTNGLLKRENAQKEKEKKRKQLTFLQEREKLLDNELNGFIQQPDMRATTDIVSLIEREILRGLEKGQEVREKSITELQSELQEQRSKLISRQRVAKYQVASNRRQTETPRKKDENDTRCFDLYMDATQPQLFQRESAAKKDKDERASTAKQKRSKILTPESTPSVLKTSQRVEASRPIKNKRFQVIVKRNGPRPFSARDLQTRIKTVKTMNYNRRKSLDGFVSRVDSKLDDAEKELKRLVPGLQKKLNINPDGYLKF